MAAGEVRGGAAGVRRRRQPAREWRPREGQELLKEAAAGVPDLKPRMRALLAKHLAAPPAT